MILKERDEPLRIILDEILLRRLNNNHKKRPEIEEDLAKRRAGLKGEKNLSYHLTFLPDGYDIIHDIRLMNSHGYAFQIDTLLLSHHYILILEVKNILGTLYFDKHSKQFTRIYNEKEEGYPNPIVQAERHHNQLEKWILSHKLPLLPIEHLVIISHPSTIIKSNDYKIFQVVFHAEHLPKKILSIEKPYKTPLDKKDYRKLSRTIVKNHVPRNLDILKTYGISKKEIITGVQCPSCSFNPIHLKHGTWICPSCNSTSKKAYQKAIEDYLYLFGCKITNKECREYLHISSRHVARRMLLEMNLNQSGNTKNSFYHW